MKIGITWYPGEGGSGVVATELGKALARLGHEVHFITSSLPVRLRCFAENIYFHEVRPDHYPLFVYPPYTLSLAAKMAEVAEAYDLDVLHAHYAMPHAACAYLAKQMLRERKIRTVTTLHGTDITLVGQAPSFYAATKFSIEESDCVTAVSDWLLGETRRVFHTERRIHVIPNFIDPDTFHPTPAAERRAQFAAEGEKVLLHISNFRPVKNVGAVVEVFDAVRRAVPARLLLVGDGPERIPTEQRVAELGLTGRVVFLGNQEYVEDILPLADVLLLPSLHESFGLVVLEAMAVGVPVVATRVGGTAEVVEDGVSGFLRDPHDVAGMAEAARRLFTEPGLAERMRAAALARARERYRVEAIVPRYVEVYEGC
jgi:N-acetyl-alpha-D-glucosaminyl L-malate synthase BshA